MVSIARKLMRHLPSMPRARYGVLAGANTGREWRQMAGAWLSSGPCEEPSVISEYESRFAKRCGARHGVSFGAGRMALYAVLEALGVGPGDEVVIPAFTCVVVPNAILYRGARPVYVDIEPRFFNIDVSKVEAAISPRTKALYAQHTFGVACDVDGLREIGRRRGLPVIEDGAHALGTVYRGGAVGSLTEVAFFSSDHSKVINTHLGGMAVTSDDSLAARLREIQARSPSPDMGTSRRLVRSFLLEYPCFSPAFLWLGRSIHALLDRAGLLFFFRDELETSKPAGYPCRLSAAQARLGLSQLGDLERNLAHRRRIAGWLEGKIGWSGMDAGELNASTWLRYSFLVKDREKFEAAFKRRFDLGVWFTSVVAGRCRDLEAVGYRPGSCPIAELAARHIVNFPTHPRVPLGAIQEEVERNWEWLGNEIRADLKRSGAR
ncbi:MAG: aminotransferase class I/II-fold pyridoxal phosphate-dependent enzyme [Elusimicrobia bacterium]|nr:aminotransferase class I/II-fold pyridoxal phosphate-dependent enzyme [Elusimicrobiota bacterium]